MVSGASVDVPLSFLLNSRKALFQVCKDIVDVFGADGQADGVGLDGLLQQLLRGQLGVGGGCRITKPIDFHQINR